MERITYDDIARTGAILDGHFVGVSGEHMPKYITKDKIVCHPDLVSKIARCMSNESNRYPAEVIVGPAMGGALIAQSVAREISNRRKVDVLSAFSEKKNNAQALRAEYQDLVRGRRVIVVDDTVNSSKSIGEVVDAVRQAGGDVRLALSIINRNGKDTEVGKKIKAPYRSLVRIPLQSYAPGSVPPELMAIPVNTKYGYGAQYLASQKT